MRVIAGSRGGRPLKAPRGDATRPTTDRVREALFSILGPLDGARVLDLYAGTGALGIEALSRGASHAVFVERLRPALQALGDNLRALELDPLSTVLSVPVERALERLVAHGPFDLVVVDPPYEHAAAALALVATFAAHEGLFAPSVRVIVEHASRASLPEVAELTQLDTRRYGDTALTFLARRPRT